VGAATLRSVGRAGGADTVGGVGWLARAGGAGSSAAPQAEVSRAKINRVSASRSPAVKRSRGRLVHRCGVRCARRVSIREAYARALGSRRDGGEGRQSRREGPEGRCCRTSRVPQRRRATETRLSSGPEGASVCGPIRVRADETSNGRSSKTHLRSQEPARGANSALRGRECRSGRPHIAPPHRSSVRFPVVQCPFPGSGHAAWGLRRPDRTALRSLARFSPPPDRTRTIPTPGLSVRKFSVESTW
jgi:hypothetical protein